MTDPKQDRLGLGGTVIAAVVGLAIGGFVGVMGTVAHRQWQLLLTTSGLLAPFGLVVALLLTAAAAIGLRLVFSSRIVALAGVVGSLAASAVFATPSSGGSILIHGDWLGYAWLIGQLVIGLAAVGVPSPRPAAPALPASGAGVEAG